MKIRKHFRVSSATIDLLSLDLVSNRIVNKEVFFNYCVNERLEKLNNLYDEKIDLITSYIIRNYNHDNLPLEALSRIVFSVTKITSVLTKGLISIISK